MSLMLKKLADNTVPGSLANRVRERRFRLFRQLVNDLPKPVHVLDIGGTELFWEQMGFAGEPGFHITLLNLSKQRIKNAGFVAVVGDARDLSMFGNQSYDVAFSNSVIEHVGNWQDQQRMANEVQRVARYMFLQTPNRHFPLEPHFLFPLFQYLPLRLQIWLVRHFRLGWFEKIPDREKAETLCRSVRLLTREELKTLFPGAEIHTERVMGLSKSFVAITRLPNFRNIHLMSIQSD